MNGEDDKLIGVTENIIIGQTVPIGTGLSEAEDEAGLKAPVFICLQSKKRPQR